MEQWDVIVLGAGAAGLYSAGQMGMRGLKVLVLDHARRIGEKIRISGGGRCNFTNLNGADPNRYLSRDPRFARHALKAHPPERFIARLRAARIGFHEKHLGQLFCDGSSQEIIKLLLDECGRGRVQIRYPVTLQEISRLDDAASCSRFRVLASDEVHQTSALVVATGGLSIPAIGASNFAWRLAQQWGIPTEPPQPGLVPLTLTAAAWQPFAALSGVALPVAVSVSPGADAGYVHSRCVRFEDDLLFTHRGLSGPAILQISSYWQAGQSLVLDLLPGMGDLAPWLLDLKHARTVLQYPPDSVPRGKRLPPQRPQLGTVLASHLPARLARTWLDHAVALSGSLMPDEVASSLAGLSDANRLAETGDTRLRQLAQAIKHWPLRPAGTEGYRKAEVTTGGIATAALDPHTLQAHAVPGSYWIGEAVDVTGWLGGYNFQWAWASAHAAASGIVAYHASRNRQLSGRR